MRTESSSRKAASRQSCGRSTAAASAPTEPAHFSAAQCVVVVGLAVGSTSLARRAWLSHRARFPPSPRTSRLTTQAPPDCTLWCVQPVGHRGACARTDLASSSPVPTSSRSPSTFHPPRPHAASLARPVDLTRRSAPVAPLATRRRSRLPSVACAPASPSARPPRPRPASILDRSPTTP